jgi:hypothetical protein
VSTVLDASPALVGASKTESEIKLTPEELRDLTAAGRARRDEEARARREAEQERKRAARQEMIERAPNWIRYIEDAMRGAANDGQNIARTRVYRQGYGADRAVVIEAVMLVVKHFQDKGFEASYDLDPTTDWYRGEPGPGPDDFYVTVRW